MHYEKEKEQFCDERDGKIYVYVDIGGQIWMAENLNYETESSVCYEDDPENCKIYGRLYNWETAMANICPDGWNLPSQEEWNILIDYVGGISTAGKYLKAASVWKEDGNGLDAYYFAAFPGGYISSADNRGVNVGYGGYWWSTSEREDSRYAYRIYMYYTYENMVWTGTAKNDKCSIRCVHD
jgi:uncharacterized protein (TIGR02145 family)